MPRQRGSLVVLLLALALVRGLIYASVVPPWQAPDEPRHFEYVKLLYAKGRLPSWEDAVPPTDGPSVEAAIIDSMDYYDFWEHGVVHWEVIPSGRFPSRFSEIWLPGMSHELHQPPLAYMAYAIVLPFAPSIIAVQLYHMRLVSVLLGVLMVLITYATMAELFPDDPMMLIGVPALVAFLPMHTFTTSAVTNDNLTALFVSLLILQQVVTLRRGLSTSRLLISVLLVLLALFSKRTGIVALPIVLTGLALCTVTDIRYSTQRPLWKQPAIIALCGLILTIGLLGLGWGHLEEFFSGVLPGSRSTLEVLRYTYIGHFLRPDSGLRSALDLSRYVTADAADYYGRFLQMLFESFWARFGWVNVRLNDVWYVLLAVICAAALVGLVLAASRELSGTRALRRYQRESLVLFGVAVICGVGLLLVKMIGDWNNMPRPLTQGKFLFPVLVPIASLLVFGLRQLTPPRHRGITLALWLTGLAAFDAIAVLGYLIPQYYG